MEAEKAAFRAKDLTGQLLTFSKGGAPIRNPLEPGALVRRAAQEVLQGSTVECEFSLPNDLWLVDGDEGQMSQVVHNIVMNAREAMPRGGRLEISVANVELTGSQPPSLREGRYIKMSFRDHGPGIPHEHMNKVFDPYFTTKEQSSGMGLATAYSILRKHDGQVMVESVEGQGATFLVYLPASTRPVPVARPMMEQIRFLGRGRILVMDDEEDILSLTQVGLEMLGYEVTAARDGAEAIDHYVRARAEGKPFEAVIMDLTVPNGLGGVETIRRLKMLDPTIKAIVSSGYSYDPVMANHREYGFSGVVPKPYRIDELGRALEELLRSGEG
jgi:CheY-like chemotaxis protein